MAQDHSVFSNIQDNRTSSLAEQVADQINQVIIDQNINAGEKLPNEFELAARLNVGRGTIREAVKLLVARNCLEIRRGKGTFVADPNWPPSALRKTKRTLCASCVSRWSTRSVPARTTARPTRNSTPMWPAAPTTV